MTPGIIALIFVVHAAFWPAVGIDPDLLQSAIFGTSLGVVGGAGYIAGSNAGYIAGSNYKRRKH
jgi:hypothetical protein